VSVHDSCRTTWTGPDFAVGFNQNPVFSIAADDGASTPGRDRQSPSHGKIDNVLGRDEHNLTTTGSARGRGKLAKSLIERDYPSDTDRTRSASPPNSVYNTAKKMATPNMRINTLLNEDGPASSSPAPKGPGRGNWSRNRQSGIGASGGPAARSFKAKLDATNSQDGQSPSTSAPTFNGPHGFYLPLNGSDPSHKRTRPLTQHQLAVEQYRRRRVDVILDRGIRIEYKQAAKRRRKTNSFVRSWIRCKGMADGYDTDEESYAQFGSSIDADGLATGSGGGTKTPPPMPSGLVPLDFGGETNDHGEESYYRAKMLSRALRRLERWEDGKLAPRGRRPKGESNANADTSLPLGGGARQGMLESGDEEDDEEAEDMMDVDDADDASEDDTEDETMLDAGGSRSAPAKWDANVLPPLPRMA
jgi:Ino eighty subunit 1